MDHKHFTDNIKMKARSALSLVTNNIEMLAEIHAEVYVSSTMGLQDDDERKKSIKDEYIWKFTEEIKRLL